MTIEEARFILANIDRRVCDDELSEALDTAIKALEQKSKYRKEARRWKNKVLGQKQVLDKIRAEIEKQEKWLWQAGIEPYNVDIAFSAIKSVVTKK